MFVARELGALPAPDNRQQIGRAIYDTVGGAPLYIERAGLLRPPA